MKDTKLKEFLSITKNKKNKQSVWNPKKRKIKQAGLTEEDILNMNMRNFANTWWQKQLEFGRNS